jgi:hypothetical protein
VLFARVKALRGTKTRPAYSIFYPWILASPDAFEGDVGHNQQVGAQSDSSRLAKKRRPMLCARGLTEHGNEGCKKRVLRFHPVSLRFPLVSITTEENHVFVSRSFPFVSVSMPIYGKQETK